MQRDPAEFKFNAVMARPPPEPDLPLRIRAILLPRNHIRTEPQMLFVGAERLDDDGVTVVPVQRAEVVDWAERWLRRNEGDLLDLLVTI